MPKYLHKIIESRRLTVQHHCLHQPHQPFCEISEGGNQQLIQVQGVRPWIETESQVADGFHLKPAVQNTTPESNDLNYQET